ncbi:hypothetical protein Pen01_73760 [Phytomonospora endophytica]|nr:hypothetical protein Pen01_73760 [Phytomonospora endophytica]
MMSLKSEKVCTKGHAGQGRSGNIVFATGNTFRQGAGDAAEPKTTPEGRSGCLLTNPDVHIERGTRLAVSGGLWVTDLQPTSRA